MNLAVIFEIGCCNHTGLSQMRDDISYVVIDTLNHALSSYALELSQKRFPLKNVIIFSDRMDCWNGRQVITIPEIDPPEITIKLFFTTCQSNQNRLCSFYSI